MPYIKVIDRNRLEDKTYLPDIGKQCKNAGELNYTITRIVHGYLEANGGRYQQINDVLGAVVGALLELYRKKVAPYEDIKETENGKV